MKTKTMNIAYCSDNNYAEITGISIISLLKNNMDVNALNVYILNDNISIDNINHLNTIFRQYNRNVVYVDASKIKIPNNLLSTRWPKSAFIRLYMASLLPLDVDKVLYLDGDVIIEESLAELWNINIDNYIRAGVKDCISNANKANLGMGKEDNYLNSGVMLINLSKWRRDNVEERILSNMMRYNNVLRFADQDILNTVLKNDSLVLSLKYNSYTVLHDFSYKDLLKYRKTDNFYNENEVREAIEKPAIIHFTSCFTSLRPWIKESKHPYADEYIKFKEQSPWYDVPISEDNRSFRKKIIQRIYISIPTCIAVRFSGWIHSTVMPWYLIRKSRFR